MNPNPNDRKHPPITHALPPEVRHAETPGAQNRGPVKENFPKKPGNPPIIRRVKCPKCKTKKKVVQFAKEAWRGEYCGKCGCRMQVYDYK
jgi:hypothetical protein